MCVTDCKAIPGEACLCSIDWPVQTCRFRTQKRKKWKVMEVMESERTWKEEKERPDGGMTLYSRGKRNIR